MQHIKAEAGKKGDLGIVAESSKGSQRTMFQPTPLTVPSVFGKLKDIAAMTGNKSMDQKVKKAFKICSSARSSRFASVFVLYFIF